MSCTQDIKLLYAVFFGSIASIGFLLNVFAIWVFFRRHSFKSPNVIFMVNLAVADLLLVCSLALRVTSYATGTWPLGCLGYILYKSLFSLNFCSSSLFITFISVDRLLAIVYPLRSRHLRTARNATKAAVTVWLFVIILTAPRIVKLGIYGNQQNERCCSKGLNHSNYTQWKVLGNFEGGFKFTLVLILLIVNIVSTFLVSLTLYRNRKGLAEINNKVNVMLLFIMSLVMFTVCFLPGAIRFFVSSKLYLKCFAVVNCCLDPVLYYFSLDSFWKKKKERNQLKPSNVI